MEERFSAPKPELTLTHLDSLPTLAPIAVRLLQITADEGSELADLVRVLRADQSLTAKIISVANSAGKQPTAYVTGRYY